MWHLQKYENFEKTFKNIIANKHAKSFCLVEFCLLCLFNKTIEYNIQLLFNGHHVLVSIHLIDVHAKTINCVNSCITFYITFHAEWLLKITIFFLE